MANPSAVINWNSVFHACLEKKSDLIGQIFHSYRNRLDVYTPPQEARSWYHQLFNKYITSVNLNWTDTRNIAQSDDHPDPNIRQGRQHRLELAPHQSTVPMDNSSEELLLPKILTHIHVHPAEHGFRPKQSTITALSTLFANIAPGFS